MRASQKLGVGPGVGKCPAPWQRKYCKCPTPGTDKAGKCRTVAWRKGGGGVGGAGGSGRSWNWLMHKLKAENFLSQMQSTYKYITKND